MVLCYVFVLSVVLFILFGVFVSVSFVGVSIWFCFMFDIFVNLFMPSREYFCKLEAV